MANEAYVAAAGDMLSAHVLQGTMRMLLAQQPFMRRLCCFDGDTRGTGSGTIKVRQVADDDIGEALAEGAAPSDNTAVGDSSFTLTPARQAVRRVLSHRLEGIDSSGLFNEIALARFNHGGVMRAFDALVCAAVASLTGTAGTTTQPFTADDWFDAQQALQERLVSGKKAALLAPFQFSNLQDDLRGETGPWQLNLEVQAQVANASGENLKGTLNGIEIWTSTQVADANTGDDHDGAMFQIPSDSTMVAETGKSNGEAALSYAEGSPDPFSVIGGAKISGEGGVVYSTITVDGGKAETIIDTHYFAAVGIQEAGRGIKIRTQHAA